MSARAKLRVLLVEDDADDAFLLARELRRGSWEIEMEQVDCAAALERALDASRWDIVISDWSLPGFSGLEALAMVRKNALDVPFLLVSGTIGEEAAVAALKAGAQDYIVKGQWGRLLPAIEREVREAATRAEARLTEAENARLRERMESAERLQSVGLLAGGVAHDVNNMLAAIRGHVELALTAPPEKAALVRRNLEVALNGTDRVADLMRQMLALAGRGRAEHGSVDLGALVREMVSLLCASVPRHHVIKVDVVHAPRVDGDASQLRQVVLNLIQNASEAIGEAEGRIEVRVRPGEPAECCAKASRIGQKTPPQNFVLLEVIDSGCGMTPETLNRIFDPFFTTKPQGRGLGMTSILGIVRGHGGDIEIQSTPGSGSTFQIWLPSVSRSTPPSDSWPVLSIDNPNLRVLHLEADPSLRALLIEMLASLGLEAVEAATSAEASRILQEDPRIGAVVIDLETDADAPGLARALRSLRPDLLLVGTSAWGDPSSLGESGGLARFLPKPYGTRELAAALHTSKTNSHS